MTNQDYDPWETEIDADNIFPEIPNDMWHQITLRAIRAAIMASTTISEALRKLKRWNKLNVPELPEKPLILLALWAIRIWENSLEHA